MVSAKKTLESGNTVVVDTEIKDLRYATVRLAFRDAPSPVELEAIKSDIELVLHMSGYPGTVEYRLETEEVKA